MNAWDHALEVSLLLNLLLLFLGSVLAAYAINEARLQPSPAVRWCFILLWPLVMLDTISGGWGSALVNRLRRNA